MGERSSESMPGSDPPSELHARLKTHDSTIRELIGIAGTAGLSLGVYKKGEPTYYSNFGHRDVTGELPVTEQTIFPGCSLTKLFTAMAFAHQVDDPEKHVDWDTPVKHVLADFNISDSVVRERTTVSDLLAHRTGISAGNFYLGSDNNMLIAHEDSLKFINDQVPVVPFRQQWRYNNLGYELAGLMIDKLSGSWADVVRTKLLSPLGLERTFIGHPSENTDNVAKAYNTLDNGTPTEIPTVKAAEGVFGGASAGLFTCTKDLLKVYAAILDAMNASFDTGLPDTPVTSNSPIKRAADLFTAKIPMAQPSFAEASYAFGLCRVQLPNTMGHIGMNPWLVSDGKMPTIAKGTDPVLVFYHQGSLPGALSAVSLIPQLEAAVVVMTNSLSLNDCPDWVLQLILEELLEAPERVDYIQLAKSSKDKTLQWYQETKSTLENEQASNTSSKPLPSYTGTYWNKQRYLKIDVTLSDDKLSWALQGLDSEKFELDHYEGDTFLWLKDRNYMAKRGRWVGQAPVFWKLRFNANAAGEITSVTWAHDADVPEGEEFFKE
ncbi:hypothetical protein ACHAQA_004521 [Verticillium albo-atrum]